MLKALGKNLIDITKGTLNSTFNDQIKGIFDCQGMRADILCMPAVRIDRSQRGNKGTEDYITSGSVFNVPVNTAAMVIENGRVRDMVIAESNDLAGQYMVDLASAPSIFAGNGTLWNNVKATFSEMASRWTYGGQATGVHHIVYINLRNIDGFRCGCGDVTIRDEEMDMSVTLAAHGTLSIRISNPQVFFEAAVMDYKKTYTTKEGAEIVTRLRSVVNANMKASFGTLARMRLPVDQLQMHTDKWAQALMQQPAIASEFGKYGLSIETENAMANALEIDIKKEDLEVIKEMQRARRIGGGNMQAGLIADRGSKAFDAAANNSNGAMAGIMGLNMMGAMTGMGMGMGMQGGYPQQGYPYPQQPQQPYPQQPQQAYPQQPVQQSAVYQQPQQPAQVNEQAQTQASDSWTCSCGQKNTMGFCMACGTKKPEPKAAENGAWTCSCGYSGNTMGFCANCGSKRPEPQAPTRTYQCDKCGWVSEDPTNPPKFCPRCGDIFDDNDITI